MQRERGLSAKHIEPAPEEESFYILPTYLNSYLYIIYYICIYKYLLLEDVSALCSAKSFSRYLGALPRSAGSSIPAVPSLAALAAAPLSRPF